MDRRQFLKLMGMTAVVVAVPVIPTFETAVYEHPEVRVVLARFPDPLLPNEKLTVARFVMSSIESGTWEIIDSFNWHAMNTESNALTNWKDEG